MPTVGGKMTIEATYLDISFDKAGVRDSQKRLKEQISKLAVEPLEAFQTELTGEFEIVEEAVAKRVAAVITYWAQHKHKPVKPGLQDMMSDITNAGKDDSTLESFYIEQVKDGMHHLAPTFGLDVPESYAVMTDELELALLELEERFENAGINTANDDDDDVWDADLDDLEDTEGYEALLLGDAYGYGHEEDTDINDREEETQPQVATPSLNMMTNGSTGKRATAGSTAAATSAPAVAMKQAPATQQVTPSTPADETHIVPSGQQAVAEVAPQAINVNLLSISAEETWHMIYNLMGFHSSYIQEKMLPRWQQFPDTFENDRRFLYNVFLQAIRNAAGVQVVAGNFSFSQRDMTVDQLWNHYYADLAQNVGPSLSAARLEAAVSDSAFKKFRQWLLREMRKISPVWMLALAIALIFDGLTTYVSLDQTPMEGFMVLVFTLLITALFQIADILVINYRKREFEADAMMAKYSAKVEQLSQTIGDLDPTSDSFVQLSMEKSQAHADWKAATDSRKMARRGGFWSARIADINIVVTAYGFAYMFLNAEEPMYAVVQQLDYIFVQQLWSAVNLWVFLMVGLAITVSFVINTAQRTEILGWSMRRLKNDG